MSNVANTPGRRGTRTSGHTDAGRDENLVGAGMASSFGGWHHTYKKLHTWSMSRKLWVRFFQRLEGVHREVTFQHPLLGAPQGYLRGQRAHTHLVGEHPYYPRPPLHLPKEPLQHVRRA